MQLLTKGNIDFFNRSFQHIFLPRVLLLGLLTSIFLLSLIIDRSIFTVLWGSLFGLISITLLISIPLKMYNSKTLNAVLYLPKGFWLMLKALFSIKGANKTFIHTEHGTPNQDIKKNSNK